MKITIFPKIRKISMPLPAFFILLLLPCITYPQNISTTGLPYYIMNPSLTGENQEPAHVPMVIFDNIDDALAGDWNRSPWYQSLDGRWKFRWDRNPYEAPAGFFESGFDPGDRDGITVPGTWQTQGYGHALYRNIPLEFSPYNPPDVPFDFNPTGSYIRTFEVPAGWKTEDIRHFDAEGYQYYDNPGTGTEWVFKR